MRRGFALVTALAVLTGAAAAETAEGALVDFGLLGTWAVDCSQPPGKDNIHSRYEAKDGKVVNVHDAGPSFVEDHYTVRTARSAGNDLMMIGIVSAAGKESEITLRRIGAMMQVWRVVGADGFAPVNDGKYIVTDAPIKALSRCR